MNVQKYLKKISTPKNVVRIIGNAEFISHMAQLLNEFRILKIHNLHKYRLQLSYKSEMTKNIRLFIQLARHSSQHSSSLDT